MSVLCEQHAVRIPLPAAARKIGLLVIYEENWFDSPEGRNVPFTVQVVLLCCSPGNGMRGAASWGITSNPGTIWVSPALGLNRGCVSCNLSYLEASDCLYRPPNIFMWQISVTIFSPSVDNLTSLKWILHSGVSCSLFHPGPRTCSVLTCALIQPGLGQEPLHWRCKVSMNQKLSLLSLFLLPTIPGVCQHCKK